MNENFVLANPSRSLSLLPLKLVLKQGSLEDQLVSKLIENLKRPYRRPSPFATWMGQPFPHEYKEMVAADVR